MPSDLDAAIRADLDYRRCQLVDPDEPSTEIAFEAMRDAIFAALAVTDPNREGHLGCGCPTCVHKRVTEAIASALEVEAIDA